jgi:anaerobic selenocysteine-containing dehydrogenase
MTNKVLFRPYKANIVTPRSLHEDSDMPEIGGAVLRLITLRSNDQFNTTVYGYDDRFRGIKGTRMVVLMNAGDVGRLGLREGEIVTLPTVAKDDVMRAMGGFRFVHYTIPAGCIGAYYPDADSLLPIWHNAEGSKTLAAKAIPVRVERS